MKAQVEIVSAMLIITLSIAFFGMAYSWLLPWIERKQAEIKIERLLDDFNPANPDSLPRKIEFVGRIGKESIFKISSSGLWKFYPSDYTGPENNSIEFYTFSKYVTGKIPIGKWWHIKRDAISSTCFPEKGSLGEMAFEACVRADPYADGYNLTYRVTFRELEESPTRGSKINLVKMEATSPLNSTSQTIKIGRGESYQRMVERKTLIITEVKISLV